MSPLMKKVENAGIKGIKQKRNPAKVKVDDFFHESDLLREAFSRLISNEDPDRVVIIPSVSYGLANVCRNLPFSDGEILVVEHQFPSNIYPWQALESNGFKLKYISAPDSDRRGASWNEEILRSIGEQTRVVAIGHIHWSDGTLFDLVAIRKRLDEVGGLLIIDGTQSVGALPFDAKEIRPDALICAGYKWLLGPYSIGLAYYGPAFDQGNPIEENWINRLHSENFSGLVDYQEMYRPSALRYEVGEHSNFILVPMLLKGINQILKWTPEKIQDYTKVLMQETIGELNDL